LISCLEDYSVDERGDVGSWIRIAASRGLGLIVPALFATAVSKDLVPLTDYLAPATFVAILAALMKEIVERLDTVRQEAGSQFVVLLKTFAEFENELGAYRPPGYDTLPQSFLWCVCVQKGIHYSAGLC
jgi:hypothetical protein